MPLANNPAYKARPELYAYNTVTKRHCLKSSIRYRKSLRRKPEEWVESATIVPASVAAPAPAVLPLAPNPQPPAQKTVIGAPLPPEPDPTPAESPRSRRERERNEAEVRRIIREEMNARKARKEKQQDATETAAALSALLEQVRLEKAKSGRQHGRPAVRRSAAPRSAEPATAVPVFRFRVAEPVTTPNEALTASDAEEYDESDS